MDYVARPQPQGTRGLRIVPPHELPTFADVGGMEALKATLRDTVGLVLANRARARDYQVAFNGLLLHGPPGTGKSHLARAIAGEFRMSLLHLSTGDLVEGVAGAGARNVTAAFDAARRARPCLLFLDEFDSIAQRRDAAGHPEERRTVNQLLVALESVQDQPDVLVVAATNDLDHLDPAVVRPGRFDRHVRVDLPDHAARVAILTVHLARRPSHDAAIDLDDLAARTDGWSAAALALLVEDAAMRAFRDAAATGEAVHIGPAHLDEALAARGGQDRPTVEQWSWEDLVLPADVRGELQQLEALLAEPDLAEQLGHRPARRRAAGRATGNRQDHGRPRAGRPVALLVLPRQRRRRVQPLARRVRTLHPAPVRPRPGQPPEHRVHRRGRRARPRPWPRRRRGGGPPAHAAARRDGRPRLDHRRDGPGGHQPPRRARPGPGAGRTAVADDHAAAARPGPAAAARCDA